MYILEECTPNGGIYAEIVRWNANSGSNIKIKRFGPEDKFVYGNPRREQLHERLKFNLECMRL
jgi:hypothetical protein